MRRLALPPPLFAATILLAQVAPEPPREAAQAACEARRQSCVAECRARHFGVDPRRAACTANCSAEADRCVREQGAARPGARN